MKPFNCPFCGIEQTDIFIEESWMLSEEGDHVTCFRCTDCLDMLEPLEIPELSAEERRLHRRQVTLNLIFWILILLALRCWLS